MFCIKNSKRALYLHISYNSKASILIRPLFSFPNTSDMVIKGYWMYSAA